MGGQMPDLSPAADRKARRGQRADTGSLPPYRRRKPAARPPRAARLPARGPPRRPATRLSFASRAAGRPSRPPARSHRPACNRVPWARRRHVSSSFSRGARHPGSHAANLGHRHRRKLDRTKTQRRELHLVALQHDGQATAVLQQQPIDGLRIAPQEEPLDFLQGEFDRSPGRGRLELRVGLAADD